MTKRNAIRAFFAALLLVAFSVYAVEQNLGPRQAFHTFDYGGIGETQDVEILNYRYGNSKVTGPASWGLASGHIAQGNGISGRMLVGETLYVKWRIPSTGKIYEDTVDLKSRLPVNMEDKTIHFSVQGPQLSVYVVESRVARQVHAPEEKNCPIVLYKAYKCSRVYPDHWANF